MKAKRKYTKLEIASMIISLLAVIALFLPYSSCLGMTSLNFDLSYNIIDIIKFAFGGADFITNVPAAYASTLVISSWLVFLVFLALIAIFFMNLFQIHISVRRVTSVAVFLTAIFAGLIFNTTLTDIAKTGNNFYGISPDFKLVIKNKAGSINQWSNFIPNLIADEQDIFTPEEDEQKVTERLNELITFSQSFDYTATDKQKRTNNQKIFDELEDIIPESQEVVVFRTYFGQMIKDVTAVSSTFGMSCAITILFGIVLCALSYNELNKNGYRNNGIPSHCMYVGISVLALAIMLLLPVAKMGTDIAAQYGMSQISIIPLLITLLSSTIMKNAAGTVIAADSMYFTIGVILFFITVICMTVYTVLAARKKAFKIRRVFPIVSVIAYIASGATIGNGIKPLESSLSIYFWLVLVLLITSAIIPFTVFAEKEKYKAFSIVNVIIFVLVCAVILVPIWKVLVDSLDASAGFGMRLWPEKFTINGYLSILEMPSIRTPFLISVLTTILGTLLGLTIATLGAYVLIQFEMPGRSLLAAMLLFTLVFEAGMVPTYLLYLKLGIYNTLAVAILPMAVNVYNLVLMRNFFDGIPKSLFESASIDGCSPMGIFFKIVLPLSKAALASIGLMFAVAYWNEYTHYKLYIVNTNIHNFQMKLRSIIFEAGLPSNDVGIETETLKNAAIMVAIIPFMVIYPFLQQYFVKGVNIGAVKE